jgi:branched-chain amino acid aminotransferase
VDASGKERKMVPESNSQAEPILYVNGEFVPRSQAKISVFDHVVLYGDGVYDTMVAWNGAIFKLQEHIDRLFESAYAIKLTVPLSKAQVREVIGQTVRCNGLRDAYVKIVVTRGVGAQPLLSPYHCTPGIIVFAVPYMSQAGDKGGDLGIKMITSSMRRVPNECISTKIKSCNYLNHVLMRMEANEAGADEAMELDLEGYVCEVPGYNVFVVKKGRLFTPKDNILVGITRATVIEIAAEEGLQVIEGRLQPFDLYTADEAFLSSTAGGIVSVGQLDGRMVADGAAGSITRLMRARYEALLESGEKSIPV